MIPPVKVIHFTCVSKCFYLFICNWFDTDEKN